MNTLSANERQARAINAAQVIAEEHGVKPGSPVILKDANHTIVTSRRSPS